MIIFPLLGRLSVPKEGPGEPHLFRQRPCLCSLNENSPKTRGGNPMRPLLKALAAGSLLMLASAAQAQVTDSATAGANDEARKRTKEIRDARHVVDDYPAENWRNAAYLIVDLTPSESGSATLEIAEKDRLKLLSVKKAESQSATQWLVADPDRIKLEVNYFQARQEVACSVAKKLRGKPVTLGIFNVYEGQVECFVRERTAAGNAPAP